MAADRRPFPSYVETAASGARPDLRRPQFERIAGSQTGPDGQPEPPDPQPEVVRTRSHRQVPTAVPPPVGATPSPFSHPGPWDTILIAGVLFLGLARVEGDTGNALDVKHAKGRDGGSITDSGVVCAEFDIEFRFWDDETWASWDQVFHAINPQRAVDAREPVDVSHPALSQRAITRIYIKSVSFPKPARDGWTCTAKCIQWHPAMTDRRGGSTTRTPRAARSTLGDTPTAFTGLSTGDGEIGQGGADGAVEGFAGADGVADPAATDTRP